MKKEGKFEKVAGEPASSKTEGEKKKIDETVVGVSGVSQEVSQAAKTTRFLEWKIKYQKRNRKFAVVVTVLGILSMIWLLYIYVSGVNAGVIDYILYTCSLWILAMVGLKFVSDREIGRRRDEAS